MSHENHTPQCRNCGDQYSTKRWGLGYKFCLPCGDKVAQQVVRTVVPMPKSNYILVTDLSLLKGLNSSHKGGTL